MRAAVVDYPGPDDAFLAKIGVLTADHRRTAPLAELFDIASGAYVSRYVSRDEGGAVPYLRVDNVRSYVPNLTEPDVVYIAAPTGAEGRRIAVSAGDVVIARTGTLGKAFVCDEALAGAALSQHLTKLTPKRCSAVSADALAAYFNSPMGSAVVEALAMGSTRLELTHSALGSLPVPLDIAQDRELIVAAAGIPELFAEMRIEAATAIRLVNELLGQASDRSGFSAFSEFLDQAALGRSLVPRFWRPEALAIEERLTKRFECRSLGAIADVSRGAGTHSSEYERDGIPYVRTSSLINYGVDILPDHYGSEALYQTQKQLVREGDILLSMEGKVGMIALLAPGERCLVKNHIEIVRPKQDTPWISAYLFAVLSSEVGQAQLRRRTVIQATIPGLGSASRELIVPLAAREVDDRERFAVVIRDVTAHMERSLEARRLLAACIKHVDSFMRQKAGSK